jgi:hypothetical protein
VIVLIAVTKKQVVITDQFATAPISGRQAIFARVAANAPTQTDYDIEIVGVYSDLDLCAGARAAHALAHPNRKYHQKVARLDDLAEPPAPSTCIRCSTPTQGGTSYCPPCQQLLWAESRAADPLNGAGDDVPLVMIR